MDVLPVETVELRQLIVSPVLTSPVVLDRFEFVRSCSMNLPNQALQNAILGNVILGVWRVADVAAAVGVTGFGASPERGTPVDRSPDFALSTDIFALMFGFDTTNAVGEHGDEVSDSSSETEVDAFDPVPVIDVEALVIEGVGECVRVERAAAEICAQFFCGRIDEVSLSETTCHRRT